MRIVVIIPTYNEAENIGKILDTLVRVEFPQIENHDMRILVVDDSSPDGTADIVRNRMRLYKGKIELLLGQKEGLGKAFARGMGYAMKNMEASAVIEMDADFQHDPKDVKRLVAAFDEGYDYVIGSRYIQGGSIPNEWEPHRKFLSWGGSMFARIVLLMPQIHDVTSGFKLTRVKGFLDHFDFAGLLSSDYAYKIHILYKMVKDRKAKTKEIPITFHFRERGSSKMETTDIRESLRVVMILLFRSRFFKFAIVGLIGFAINAVMLEVFRMLPVFEKLAISFNYLKNTPLTLLSQPSAWAAAAATEVSIVSNFLFNNFWTFEKEKIEPSARMAKRFFEFNLTSTGAIIIQFITIGAAVHFFGDTRIIRQIALVIGVGFFVVPYNYTMYNIFIWRRWRIPWLPFLYKKGTH